VPPLSNILASAALTRVRSTNQQKVEKTQLRKHSLIRGLQLVVTEASGWPIPLPRPGIAGYGHTLVFFERNAHKWTLKNHPIIKIASASRKATAGPRESNCSWCSMPTLRVRQASKSFYTVFQGRARPSGWD